MHYTKELTRCALGMLAGILLVSATQGCAVIGPSSVSRGRVAYAEVIAETNAEQSLATLVRVRYGAPWILLAVSSVTAQVRFSTDARAEFGVGPKANFAGALVPLAAASLTMRIPRSLTCRCRETNICSSCCRLSPRNFSCPLSTARLIPRTLSHCW